MAVVASSARLRSAPSASAAWINRKSKTDIRERDGIYSAARQQSVLEVDVLEAGKMDNKAVCHNAPTLAMVHWLKAVPVDEHTINALVSHGFTLDILLHMACKDDLKYCGIKGGMVCYLWRAISAQRKSNRSVVTEDSEETIL